VRTNQDIPADWVVDLVRAYMSRENPAQLSRYIKETLSRSMIEGGLYTLAVEWLETSIETITNFEIWQKQRLLSRIEAAKSLAITQTLKINAKASKSTTSSLTSIPISSSENQTAVEVKVPEVDEEMVEDFNFHGR
jgi:hypothetical protein